MGTDTVTVHNPPRPTHEGLENALGSPPWALTVPDFDGVPEESTDCVGMLVWRNRIFTATGMLFDDAGRA